MDIWDKHRHRTNQSICIIGILILGTKLCQADGDFTQVEREELLKIFPHDEKEKEKMDTVIKDAENDNNSIEYHAQRIKKYITNDNYVFLEFIIAVLYKLAHVDHVYSKEEDEDIRKVAKIFGIKKPWFERCYLYLKEWIFNFYNAKFRKNTL
tara:strand:- start:1442 stop:1900 length:459 start_codon:yes stop_codon:yes gene_type:complete